jgi:hypothetical protein
MEITGATFNFIKKVSGKAETTATPEKPVNTDGEKKPTTAGDEEKKEGGAKSKNKIGAFAYDMIKTSIQQTLSAITSNVAGSATMQVQLQAAQQVGGKILTYTMAAATGNWAAIATMAVADTISFGAKQANFGREKAWTDYDLDQYQARRGYSTARNRK